jgi:hypothetical protein
MIENPIPAAGLVYIGFSIDATKRRYNNTNGQPVKETTCLRITVWKYLCQP